MNGNNRSTQHDRNTDLLASFVSDGQQPTLDLQCGSSRWWCSWQQALELTDAVRLVEELIPIPHRLLGVLVDRNGDRLE
jgi:hypothetical protein